MPDCTCSLHDVGTSLGGRNMCLGRRTVEGFRTGRFPVSLYDKLQWPSSSEAPQRLHPVGISMLPGEIDELQTPASAGPLGAMQTFEPCNGEPLRCSLRLRRTILTYVANLAQRPLSNRKLRPNNGARGAQMRERSPQFGMCTWFPVAVSETRLPRTWKVGNNKSESQLGNRIMESHIGNTMHHHLNTRGET